MRGGPASHIDQGRHSRFTARVLQRLDDALHHTRLYCAFVIYHHRKRETMLIVT